MKKQKLFTRIAAISLVLMMLFLTGCRDKSSLQSDKRQELKITLQVWNLFDDSDIYEPLFSEFKSRYLGLQIEYRKFENVDEYLDLLLNELAEGEGPDIFFIHNSWIPKHYKKISPADPNFVPVDAFRDTFVSVAADDCVIKELVGEGEAQQVVESVYCMPTYVDNLALYYNSSHFEEVLPEVGRPAATWEEIKDQVFKLTKQDNSFERFARSGIAMGRTDNISRAYDIFQLFLLQSGADLYTEDGRQAIFADQQGVSSAGQAYYPAREAAELYTSFANEENKQYSWNKLIANPKSDEKEITPFVGGKLSMMLGYSYLYDELKDQIELQSNKGVKTVSPNVIKTAPVPQVFDDSSGRTKVTLASYFAPTVARTSANPDIAWQLISFLNTKENQQYYNEKTHRPSSRRDLIDEQSAQAIYGVFSSQIGYSKSFRTADSDKYEEIFLEALSSIVENKKRSVDAMKDAQAAVNEVLQVRRVF